ncbi:hypothetical protein D3C86_1161450 [compost metagenome]
MVTPELKGVFPPEEVSRTALELLASPSRRRDIMLDLSHAMGPAGAAEAVVAQVAAMLAPLPGVEALEATAPEGGLR